jgi:aminopeptidase N
MLRNVMADGQAGPEERFFTMLRDFVATYRGQYPSTKDFIRHAEKYMTPVMDVDRDHHLDWFFNDWVYGTGIPTYKVEVSTHRASPKKYVIEGTIEQSDVPPQFEMPVPVVAYYSKDRKERLGWVVVSASGAQFRYTTSEKPSRVTIDEDSILAVVR